MVRKWHLSVAALVAASQISLAGAEQAGQRSGQQDRKGEGQPKAAQDQGGRQQDTSMRSDSLRKVREVMSNWESKSWDEILAEDATLTLRLADVVQSADGTPALVALSTDVQGREKVKQALDDLYKQYHRQITITTEMLSGDEAILLGDVRLQSARKGQGQPSKPADADQGKAAQKSADNTIPLTIYMHFNQAGKIDRMTVSSLDIETATQSDGGKAPTQK